MPPSRKKHSRLLRFLLWPVIAITVLFLVLWFQPWPAPSSVGVPPTLDPSRAITPDNVARVSLQAHAGNGIFYSLAWSPDGRSLAVGTTLGVNLYDAGTSHLIRAIRLPLRNIGLLSFSPQGDRLAVAAEPGQILLLRLSDDQVLGQWDLVQPVVALDWLEDGTLICMTDMQAGNNQKLIQKLVGDRWEPVRELEAGFLLDAAFDSQAQAFTAFYADSVRSIDPLTGTETLTPYRVPYGGEFALAGDVLLAIDRDLSLLSVTRGDGTQKQVELPGMISHPVLTPDGNLFAAFGQDPKSGLDTVELWDVQDLELLRRFQLPDLSPYSPNQLAFSPSGDRLAVLVSGSTVKVFPVSQAASGEVVIRDPYSGLADLAVSADAQMLALSCFDHEIQVLSLPALDPLARWTFDTPACGMLLSGAAAVVVAEPYRDLRRIPVDGTSPQVTIQHPCCSFFSNDGQVGASSGGIASSGDPVTVTLWRQGALFHRTWKFYHDGTEAFNMAVSPSGRYVAAAGPNRTILWMDGRKSSRQYPALLSSIAFSPDEKHVASTSAILDLETGSLTPLAGPQAVNPRAGRAPAFSPDGSLLAGAVDGTLRFWRVSDGALLAILPDPDGTAWKLVFSPDGTFLLGLGEGFYNVWGIQAAGR